MLSVRSSRGPVGSSVVSSAAGVAAQPLRMRALAPRRAKPLSAALAPRERPALAVVKTPMVLLA